MYRIVIDADGQSWSFTYRSKEKAAAAHEEICNHLATSLKPFVRVEDDSGFALIKAEFIRVVLIINMREHVALDVEATQLIQKAAAEARAANQDAAVDSEFIILGKENLQ